MRILYISSIPEDQSELLIKHEVTTLERHLRAKAGSEVEIRFLPAVAFEDIRNEVEAFIPDAIHFSAHGRDKKILLTNSQGESVGLSAANIQAAIGNVQPKVVFLSACSSEPLAKALAKKLPLAIGTTVDVEDFAMLEASLSFYENLCSGLSIQAAFVCADQLLHTFMPGARLRLHSRSRELAREVLFYPPQLVARFGDLDNQGGGYFSFEPGFMGAPQDTTQIVYFTDDLSFKQTKSLEKDLCWISRDLQWKRPFRWLDDEWNCEDDFNLFATAVTQSGHHRTVHARVSDALSAFYSWKAAKSGKPTPKRILKLIREMREDDSDI